MKNEPWIDRVYKENLQTREIKLDYAHWLQAERLIEEQEKRKKKKRFLFWVLMVSAVCFISFGSLVYFKPTTTIQNQNPPSEFLTPEPGEIQFRSADTVSTSDRPIASTENDPERAVASIENEAKFEKQVITSNHSLVTEKVAFKPKNTIKSSGYKVYARSANTLIEQNSLSDIVTGVNDKSAYSEIDPDRAESQKMQLKLDVNTLDQIKTNIAEVDRNNRINTNTFDPIVPIKVEKRRWAEKGIRTTLAQEVNNGNSGSTISQAGLEFFYQRSVNRILFYGFSAGYLSNFNKVRYAQVLTEYKYQGFGAQVNNYGIKPNWLQYGFVQLTGGLEWKRHRVLLNARPEFLFATKGKLDQIKFTDPTNLKTLSDAQISSVNQGWLQNDVMNKISVTASLGYEFRIMERVGLGIQLNRVLKSPYKPLQGGIVQNAVADWNTGFRFSYILK